MLSTSTTSSPAPSEVDTGFCFSNNNNKEFSGDEPREEQPVGPSTVWQPTQLSGQMNPSVLTMEALEALANKGYCKKKIEDLPKQYRSKGLCVMALGIKDDNDR
jgi:hypothetical protein